jgi:hypothetical protein
MIEACAGEVGLPSKRSVGLSGAKPRGRGDAVLGDLLGCDSVVRGADDRDQREPRGFAISGASLGNVQGEIPARCRQLRS